MDNSDIFVCTFLYEQEDPMTTEILRLISINVPNIIHPIMATDLVKDKVKKSGMNCRYPCFLIKKPHDQTKMEDATIDKAKIIIATIRKML
jgi:hypothetical protein